MCNFVLRNGNLCQRRGRNHRLSQMGYCTFHYNRNERNERNEVYLAPLVLPENPFIPVQNNNSRRRRNRRRRRARAFQEEVIETLPAVVNHENEEKCDSCYETVSQTCSICLSEIKCSKNHYITECIHHYHEECFQTWYRRNKTCPICRQKNIAYDRPLYHKLTQRQYTNLENTILGLNMEDVLTLLRNNRVRHKLFMD